MIPHLPTEIVINVYSNLYIKEIHDTQIICKRWNNFVKSNESPLYRGAAVKHQFVSPNTSWQDVQKLYPGAWLARDKGWKELCEGIRASLFRRVLKFTYLILQVSGGSNSSEVGRVGMRIHLL